MTRLIDADKLIEEFKGRCICNCDRCKYQRGAYCGLIDNAPTVEDPNVKLVASVFLSIADQVNAIRDEQEAVNGD